MNVAVKTKVDEKTYCNSEAFDIKIKEMAREMLVSIVACEELFELDEAAQYYTFIGVVDHAVHDLVELQSLNMEHQRVIVHMISMQNQNNKLMKDLEHK